MTRALTGRRAFLLVTLLTACEGGGTGGDDDAATPDASGDGPVADECGPPALDASPGTGSWDAPWSDEVHFSLRNVSSEIRYVVLRATSCAGHSVARVEATGATVLPLGLNSDCTSGGPELELRPLAPGEEYEVRWNLHYWTTDRQSLLCDCVSRDRLARVGEGNGSYRVTFAVEDALPMGCTQDPWGLYECPTDSSTSVVPPMCPSSRTVSVDFDYIYTGSDLIVMVPIS